MTVQTAGTCSSLNQRRPSALHGRPLRRARRRRVQGQRADPPKVEPGIALVTKAELCGTGCQVGACWWPTTPRGGALRSRRPADGRVRRGPAHHRPKQMVGLATSRVAGELDEHPHCSGTGYSRVAARRSLGSQVGCRSWRPELTWWSIAGDQTGRSRVTDNSH